MKYIVGLILFIIITFSSYGMFLYSTRARRAETLQARMKNRAYTNLSMGAMLAGLATIIMLSGTMTTLRIIVAIIFYLIALYNLYSGFRNMSK